jgi:hypothetical protein
MAAANGKSPGFVDIPQRNEDIAPPPKGGIFDFLGCPAGQFSRSLR